MSGDIEAAGDIVTGGLIAKAIEPGGARHGGAQHGACLDCGTALIGLHCHACGQAAHLHSTMSGFAHEVLHGVFHFEGKIWRTLPMLAFHPGHLTRRYVDGERTRFVSPMALFLFSVFLMFAVVAQMPAFRGMEEAAAGVGGGLSEARREMATGTEVKRAAIARLEGQRAALERQGAPVGAIKLAIANTRRDLAGLEAADRLLPGGAEASPKLKAEAEGRQPTRAERNNWIERKIEHVSENPKLFLYKMKSYGYKYSWALIPISLPFIWLLFFWKRQFGMYDHAVFATYSLAFMSLMVVALSFPLSFGNMAVAGLAWTAFFLIPPIHMYKQLKYGYLLGRFGAAVRTFILLAIVGLTSLLFFLLLLYLGGAE